MDNYRDLGYGIPEKDVVEIFNKMEHSAGFDTKSCRYFVKHHTRFNPHDLGLTLLVNNRLNIQSIEVVPKVINQKETLLIYFTLMEDESI